MGEDNYTFEDLTAILPEFWREKAKELGALQRAREIKTPEDLLKLIFLYLTEGKSFGNTWALLTMSESCHLTLGKTTWSSPTVHTEPLGG
jgi:hypothetical protein